MFATATVRFPVLPNASQHAMTLYHVKIEGKNTSPITMITVIELLNRCFMSVLKMRQIFLIYRTSPFSSDFDSDA